MIFDANLTFGENESLTASGAIGSSLDLTVVNPNIGTGKKKYLAVVVNTALASGGSNGTAKFSLQDSADDSSFSDIVSGKQYAEGELSANDIVLIPIPNDVRRYVKAYATLGGTSTTITVSAYITTKD